MSKVTSHHNDLIKKLLLSVATTLGKGPGATQQVGTVAARISTDLRSSPTILGPTRPAATTERGSEESFVTQTILYSILTTIWR